MLLESLFSSPMVFLVWIVAIVVALSVHEFAHALAAFWMGDNTAKNLGRLNLNPLSHISWPGFFMLLLVGFGWGKPVPFNPYNLKYKKYGSALVAIAGPVSNLLMAIFSIVVLKILLFVNVFSPENLLIQFLYLFIILNVILMVFNLIPVPPLDGSKLLYAFLDPIKHEKFIIFLETRGPILLIFLLILDNVFDLSIFSGLFSVVINFVYRLFL